MHTTGALTMEWMMNRLWMVLAALLLLPGCFDILDTPPRQCDAERRCAPTDDPVCGDDGDWYPCARQMECVGIEAAPEPVCEDGCADPQCPFDCANTVTTTDDDGCLTCECAPACPPLPRDCETEIGDDGCQHCVEEVECEPVACQLFCEDGFATDEDGCEICACKDIECSSNIACADGCGPVFDDNGCVVDCDCTSTCDPVDFQACDARDNCRIEVDETGCETCVCEPDDQCQRLFCDNYCEHGYEIVDGCPTCQCHTPCNDMPECDLFCPNGNTGDPLTGCVNSCECRPEESCSPVMCTLFCSNGFKTDENGCEVCECRGEQCSSDEDCALNEHCVFPGLGPADGQALGACEPVERCDADLQCADGGPCGFYFRTDCCPPLTTCTDNLPSCPAVCLF